MKDNIGGLLFSLGRKYKGGVPLQLLPQSSSNTTDWFLILKKEYCT